ncbi:MAG TPA: PilZ domain-containing protein [Mycobacteriales bacterium]|nr:PilZ domain-containing protein [Mycobacteriales bacterium]
MAGSAGGRGTPLQPAQLRPRLGRVPVDRVDAGHDLRRFRPGREGGLRCRLPKPKDQKDQDAQGSRALAALDGQVTVRFTLEGEEFTMPGTVVRTIPVEGGGRELGIRFVGVTRGSADSIRRAVFAVERRQRAAGVLG